MSAGDTVGTGLRGTDGSGRHRVDCYAAGILAAAFTEVGQQGKDTDADISSGAGKEDDES